MIKLYQRLLRNVRTVNGLNRVQVELENALTPQLAWSMAPQVVTSPATQFLALPGPAASPPTGMTLGEALFIGSEEWRERLMRHMALAGKLRPEPFDRIRLRRDVYLFSGPDAGARKRLLIVFAGGAKRPMMPVHVFLQHLNAERTDVLFLRDPQRDAFRGGLFGIGSTVEDVIDALPNLIDCSSYAGVSTLGTSAGGIPALLAGLSLGARSILSVGGNHPNRWTFRGAPLSDILPDLRCRTGFQSRILLMVGAQSLDDHAAAEATACLLGASILTVTDKANPVRHGALFPLAQQRRLSILLEALLSGEMNDLPLRVPSLLARDVPGEPPCVHP